MIDFKLKFRDDGKNYPHFCVKELGVEEGECKPVLGNIFINENALGKPLIELGISQLPTS